jgi:PAS domain S-box-containing protein
MSEVEAELTTPPPARNEDADLRRILEGTAASTGEDFFRALVCNLAQVMDVSGAWVTEFLPEQQRLRTIAFWLNGQFVEGFEYNIRDTPCEPVITECRTFHVPDRIVELYPGDNSLEELSAVSYLGAPLLDTQGRPAGHLAVLDSRPMPEIRRQQTLLGIFAARAEAELRRVRAEQALRMREQQLSRLLDGAMDAIVELDQEFRVTMSNAAAEKVLGISTADTSVTLEDLFTSPSLRTVLQWIRQLESSAGDPATARSVWIPEVLEAKRHDGSTFRAETTLSYRQLDGRRFYTLICRDVNDRVQAERQIRQLTDEAARLREQIASQQPRTQLLGQSQPMRRVCREIEEVAQTDATVLILGETGTGKEVVARAIHTASRRRDKPLITVNCAAIPSNLMESEFFGHEKGAFTGATQKREGRFALADGGTIFLDEIGELPLELQGKLLRVLQEGEFEPVGSSRTRRCDVRIIAATNQNLATLVEAGRFRQDLYYRLNVYPIALPPLRDRGDDIVLLAESFAQRAAEKLGRRIEPLTAGCAGRLKGYAWPGNVRELENVIERGVITARNGRVNLDRALPEAPPPEVSADPGAGDEQILTRHQLEQIERQNIERALRRTAGRVAGATGAAALLGIPPTTLTSRIKALGISRQASC